MSVPEPDGDAAEQGSAAGEADAGDAAPPPGEGGGPGRASKADVAAQEKGERVYSETYGRDAGERFEAADYPHAYGSPGRLDWRRALRAYVDGHDRGWEADRKYALAAEKSGDGAADEREPGAAGEAAPADAATAQTGRGTRFGVGVADPGEMTFHRSASTWRERLPRSPRMPRHADRDLDGRRGRGGQA